MFCLFKRNKSLLLKKLNMQYFKNKGDSTANSSFFLYTFTIAHSVSHEVTFLALAVSTCLLQPP